MEGVTSQLIFDRLTCGEKTMIKKDELLALLQNKTFEVLVTIGAGDIDKYLTPISNLLKSRQ